MDVLELGAPPTCPLPIGADIPAEMAPMCVNVSDPQRVYHCWAEGCPEGPSSSHAAICTPVCCPHLGTKLSCSFCHVLFFLFLMPSSGMASGHIKLPFHALIRILLCTGYMYKKEIILLFKKITLLAFSCPTSNLKKESHVVHCSYTLYLNYV